MTVLRPLLPPQTPPPSGTPGPPAAAPAPTGAGPDDQRARVAAGRRVVLAQFVLSSFAVVLVLATIGAVGLSRVATREALGDARAVTAALVRSTIAPALTTAALDGDPKALAKLDKVIREARPVRADRAREGVEHRRADPVLRRVGADR